MSSLFSAMFTQLLKRWPKNYMQAKEIQLQLAQRVSLLDTERPIRRVAGVDVGLINGGKTARAVVAFIDMESLRLTHFIVATAPVLFPYVPGYLSFRELPAILTAFSQCKELPDLILCDGQGIAHPRRFGVACHLGVLLERPAIGVAKSRLIGDYRIPEEEKGSCSELIHNGTVIGAVVRTRSGVKPLFVSPGHQISIQSAIDWTLKLTSHYRLPEATRWADKIASDKTGKYECE